MKKITCTRFPTVVSIIKDKLILSKSEAENTATIVWNYLIKPQVIAGIGNSGVDCAKRAFPELKIQYIWHPSFGGKSEFIEGQNEII